MVETEIGEQLEKLLNKNYSYMSRIAEYKNLYFSESGKCRLSNILGWINGLVSAGKTDLANALAEDLEHKLETLNQSRDNVELYGNIQTSEELNDLNDTVLVPSKKVILSDDGTFNSFGFLTLFPVSPEKYNQTFWEMRAKYSNYNVAVEETEKKLRIVKELDGKDIIGQWAVAQESRISVKVFYSAGYNGGLIYHGPAAGETFTTNIGNKYWGLHT